MEIGYAGYLGIIIAVCLLVAGLVFARNRGWLGRK